MGSTGWLVVAVAAAYGAAGAAGLVRAGVPGRVGAVLGWGFVPVVLACLLLIPARAVGLRAASAFVSVELGFKMVDFFRQWDALPRRGVLREYLRVLVPLPVLAGVYPEHHRRLRVPDPVGVNLIRIGAGAAGFLLALVVVRGFSGVGVLRSSFVLNHLAILPVFVVAVESLSRAVWGVERMAGFDTRPIIRNVYRARTVAEFWRRYNDRIHDWLYRNVFRPSGGRHAPVRGILLVFVVSGVLHEVMFAMATSRWTGYQLAFFAVQGPAVLASGAMERMARRGGWVGKVLAHATAIAFMAVTSVLFLDGVRRVFPFVYASASPLE